MIGKLTGVVDSTYGDHAIIDVNGVGYLVFCSGKTLANMGTGEVVKLLIETHVREDHIHLYGFVSNEEKSTFTLLQSVKGVGTRMSLAILSCLSPEEISYSLAMKDMAAFSQVSGVGKKLAERIVTELKDKYSANYIGDMPLNSTHHAAGVSNIPLDAIAALVSLGVNKMDAQTRVSSILAQDKDVSLNELIRLALRNN
jgi:Holliday junction DNA helicase RuvA